MPRLVRLLPVLALLPLLATPASAATSDLAVVRELATPSFPQWASSTPPELFSSAVSGDVDGDGAADVVAGYQNGHVYAWHADGTRFLDIATPGLGSVRATPSLVDLNKDGKLDILGGNAAGYVYAYDGGGHRLFATLVTTYHGLKEVFGSPVAADVTGDGVLEIIASSHDHSLWVWDLAGRNKAGFPMFMADTMWASPAIADLNLDGRRDIVVTYDCAGGSGSRCEGRGSGSFVTVVTGAGKVMPGWPKFVAGQSVWSSPAIADITGDGRPEVVVGTGLLKPNPAGSFVSAWDATGHVIAGWPARTRSRVFASPAVGDVNGDGKVEITAIDDKNYVYLWDGSGHALSGWPICGTNNGTCNSVAHSSSVLADITGDGLADIIAAGQNTVRAWDRAGHLLTSAIAPRGFAGTSATPSVTSIGGKATVLLSSVHRQANGSVNGSVLQLSTGAALGPAPWPAFHQSARGTGHLDDFVTPSATTVTASMVAATRARVSMTATDVGTGVTAFDAYYRDNGGALVRWLPGTAPTSRSGDSATHTRNMNVQQGHHYRWQVRARDRDGNYGAWGTFDLAVP